MELEYVQKVLDCRFYAEVATKGGIYDPVEQTPWTLWVRSMSPNKDQHHVASIIPLLDNEILLQPPSDTEHRVFKMWDEVYDFLSYPGEVLHAHRNESYEQGRS